MIRGLADYAHKEVLPRLFSLFFCSDFWLSAILGFACAYRGHYVLPVAAIKVSEIAAALLSYGALALGFCLAGLTLILTLPNKALVSELVSSTSPNNKRDAYSNLIFIFSWTALSHWAVIVTSILLLLLAGNKMIWVEAPTHRFRIIAGLVSTLAVYCVFQFLLILITLYQFAKVVIAHHRKDPIGSSS